MTILSAISDEVGPAAGGGGRLGLLDRHLVTLKCEVEWGSCVGF